MEKTPDQKHDLALESQIEDLSSMSERGEHNGHQMSTSLSCLTTEEYKKVGRKATLKLDVVMLPCLVIMYILNYLDRNYIAVAKLAGITEDLDLSPTEYQSYISILFAGYSKYQVEWGFQL